MNWFKEKQDLCHISHQIYHERDKILLQIAKEQETWSGSFGRTFWVACEQFHYITWHMVSCSLLLPNCSFGHFPRLFPSLFAPHPLFWHRWNCDLNYNTCISRQSFRRYTQSRARVPSDFMTDVRVPPRSITASIFVWCNPSLEAQEHVSQLNLS